MAAGSAYSRSGIIEGINVTPLVDVVLVLLIIFIVTAKIVVAPAVPLDLPTASTSQDVQAVFAVNVTPEGSIVVDGVACTDETLRVKARQALARDPTLRTVIQADRAVPHGRVMFVLDELKASGVERVAFGAVRPASVAAGSARAADAADSTVR